MTILDKLPEGKGVGVWISTGESLVSHIKEDKEIFLLDELGQFSPLIGSWVNTGRVVSTSVQEDGRLVWGGLMVRK